MRIQAAAICALIGCVILFSPATVNAVANNPNNQTSATNSVPCDVTTPTAATAAVTQCPVPDQFSAIGCPNATNTLDCIHSGATYPSVSSTSGSARIPVDVWNYCRYVDNTTSGNSPVFVPFNTAPEWTDFINAWDNNGAIKNYANLFHCARPYTPPTNPGPEALPPDTNPASPTYCNSPVLQTPPAKLPYAHTDLSVTAQVPDYADYQCTDNACAIPTWTERATGQYQPGDSDPNSPNNPPYGWYLTGPITYSPAAPTCVAGLCGLPVFQRNGNWMGLCTSGTSSTSSWVPAATPIVWQCTGTNGGVTANCNGSGPVVDGQCGATQDSCTAGTYPGNDTNDGINYYWTCNGANGGTNASCSVPMGTNGQCGSANGVADPVAPWQNNNGNICSAGNGNNGGVSGSNWTWTCDGINGGTTASCSAPMGGVCVAVGQTWPMPVCGAASLTCNSGFPSIGLINLSGQWLCDIAPGGVGAGSSPCAVTCP